MGSSVGAGDRASLIRRTVVDVLAGGLLGWGAVFAGLGLYGLLLGLLGTAILLLRVSRSVPRSLGFVAGLALAIALLTWPVLWLAVAYIRYLITGEGLDGG